MALDEPSFLEIGAGREFIVRVEDLPDDISRVRALLDNEQAPMDVWIDVAKAYLANGKPQECESLLNKVVDMSEADLPSMMYNDPAAASEQRQMLKFAQIQAYCFLAQMKLDEAVANGKADAALVNTANNLLQRAEELDRDEGMLVILRGRVQMLQENYQAARMTFQRAKAMKVNRTASSVAPHLALAQLHLLQRDYRAALAQYIEALEKAHHTEGANAIRLGIGICHINLGDLKLARHAFERVVSIDENSAEAIAGLAAVELLAPEGTIERFVDLLSAAHRLDPQSSPLNTVLAQFHLVRGSLLAAESCAQVSTATDKCTRAQALCVLARVMQAKGKTSHALSLFTESIEQHELPLAVYGYAQMLIQQGQDVNATTELEKVLKVLSSDSDALLLMGRLLPHVTTGIPSQQRLDLLKEGAMHHIFNPDIQETLGEVLAVAEPGSSVSAFLRALDLQRKAFAAGTGPEPSARLLNNTGVLQYRSQRYTEALELMQDALDRFQKSGPDEPLWQDSLAVVRFNIARCQEAQGAVQTAQTGYEEILKEHPDFVDCWMRLGYILVSRGKRADAEQLFKKCAALDDDPVQGPSKRPNLQNYARKLLECASTDESKSFAHVLHGNVYFHSAPPPSKEPKQEEKRFTHLSSAARHFKQALELQKGNIYAANGLGAVAGSLGQLDAARTILSQLRESAALASGFVEVPDVWVNLGSLHLARGEANDAARMYTAALTRFYRNKDPKVSVWVARAHYDAKDDDSCKRALLKAIHLFPDDQALYFNLALTMQHYANTVSVITMYLYMSLSNPPKGVRELQNFYVCDTVVIGRPPNPEAQPGSTRAELEEASVALIQAAGLFGRLKRLPKGQLHIKGLKKDNIASHVKHIEKLTMKARVLINKVKADDEIRQKQVDEQEQRTQIMREAAEVQRRMQAETERSKAAEREAMLAESQRRWRERNKQWMEDRAMLAAARKGDANKAAKSRQKQKELEAEAEAHMQYGAEVAALMAQGESSSDEEYDEDAIARDAAEAEAEEKRALEAGYNSNDEKGTADVADGEPRKSSKKKHGKKRHRKETALEDPGADGLVDGLGDDLEGEDAAAPAEKKRAVLESDDE